MPKKKAGAPRRGRPRADPTARAAHILRAAARTLVAAGIDGATMDEVAAEAGVAKLAIYRLFPTKTALVAQALGEAKKEIEEALSCWPNPREVVARVLAYARKEPDLFQLLFRAVRGHHSFAKVYEDIEDLSARQLVVLVRHPSRGPAPASVLRAARAMAALLHEAMVAHAAEAPPAKDETFLDWCEAIINGWRKETIRHMS